MTPAELRAARESLGLSQAAFAAAVQVESGRTVRRWEAGERDIPGPVRVLTRLLLRSAQARKALGLAPPLEKCPAQTKRPAAGATGPGGRQFSRAKW